MNKFRKLMRVALVAIMALCFSVALFVACEPAEEGDTFSVTVLPYNKFLGTISFDKESYNDGDTVIATIAPKSGQELFKLVVNEQNVTDQVVNQDGALTYSFVINQDTQVEIAFKSIDKWVFTVEEYDEIAGTVSVSPAQDEYVKNSEITVSVTANEGYEIDSVTFNGNEITLNSGSYTFTITQNSTLSVEFNPTVFYTVEVNGLSQDEEEFAIVSFSQSEEEYATNVKVTLKLSVKLGYVLTAATLNEQDVTDMFKSVGGSYEITFTENVVFDFTFGEEDLTVIEEITAADFDDYVNREGKVLVYFSAYWCTTCPYALENLIEVANKDLGVKIVKIEYGDTPDDPNDPDAWTAEQILFSKYSREFASGGTIPLFMMFEDGQPVAGKDGLISVETIESLIANDIEYYN